MQQVAPCAQPCSSGGQAPLLDLPALYVIRLPPLILSSPYSPGIKGPSLSRDRKHLLTLRCAAWCPRKPYCLSFPHSGLVSCLPRPGQHRPEGLCLLCGHLIDPADRGCWLALLSAPVGPLHCLPGPGAHHHCSDTGASQKAGVKLALAST